MYGSFIGNTAEDTIRTNFNIYIIRNKNINASKDCRYLNRTVFFDNSVTEIALHTAKGCGKLCALKYFAVIIQITTGECGTANLCFAAVLLDFSDNFVCFVAKKTGENHLKSTALSGNVSANLLGLGNAATPMGIRAATRMAAGCGGVASNELCRLVVLNTASVQLLPTTVAALRSAAGCETPLDILPAVWLSSVLSVLSGVLAARLLSRFRAPAVRGAYRRNRVWICC